MRRREQETGRARFGGRGGGAAGPYALGGLAPCKLGLDGGFDGLAGRLAAGEGEERRAKADGVRE